MTEAVEAVKSSLRQSKDGLVISFVVHPSDDARHLLEMDIGQRVMLAVAPIVELEKVERDEDLPTIEDVRGILAPEPEKRPRKGPIHTWDLSQQAWWYCNKDEGFRGWAAPTTGYTPKQCEIWLKEALDIVSFTQLDDNANSDRRDRFIGLVERFEVEANRRARP